VGLDAPDDAAVWDINDKQALVVTTDFFTPIVDDAYDYGCIAAANALSDLYAMGAKPLFALNIAAMPNDLPISIIEDIIRGGAEKVREAGAVIAGGHTIQDREPKYGLVAIGLVDKDKMMTKASARSGDLIVLTKPLGTGVTTTAIRAGKSSQKDIVDVVKWMASLNNRASDLAREFDIRAATDVTGFGILGHASEIAEASSVGLSFNLKSIPFLRNAYAYAQAGHFPGGSANNMKYYRAKIQFEDAVDRISRMLLFDAQTSGGLLLMVPRNMWDDFSARASSLSIPVWPIGDVDDGEQIRVLEKAHASKGSIEFHNNEIKFL